MAIAAPPARRRLALLIATSQYEDPAFDQLRGATGDTSALKRVLGDPAIGDFHIVDSLIDRSKQDVDEAISEFFTSGRPKDLLLLYLSGHGVLSESRRYWFFATTNHEA
jgi:Caspase domain